MAAQRGFGLFGLFGDKARKGIGVKVVHTLAHLAFGVDPGLHQLLDFVLFFLRVGTHHAHWAARLHSLFLVLHSAKPAPPFFLVLQPLPPEVVMNGIFLRELIESESLAEAELRSVAVFLEGGLDAINGVVRWARFAAVKIRLVFNLQAPKVLVELGNFLVDFHWVASRGGVQIGLYPGARSGSNPRVF